MKMCENVNLPQLYKILDVEKTATFEEIKKAFRKKIKEYHPDKGGKKEDYELAQKAYEVLSDPSKRQYYNDTGNFEKKVEDEFILEFNRRKESINENKENNLIADLKKIIIATPDSSHTSKFDEWLRTRNTDNVIDDDYLIEKFGVCKSAYNSVKHECNHPILYIARNPNLTFSDVKNVSDGLRLSRKKLRPELCWGEVLVNMRFSPINPYTFLLLRFSEDVLWSSFLSENNHNKPFMGQSDDFNLNDNDLSGSNDDPVGSNGVGIVTCIGPGVKALRVGDFVLPLYDFIPTWKVADIWQEKNAIFIPSSIMPMEYLAVSKELFLAYYLLQKFCSDLKPGDSIIISAANSFVSQTMIQLAKILSIKTICIVRYHSKESFSQMSEYLQNLGASKVFAETDTVIARKLQKEFLALPKVAFDSVGGDSFPLQVLSVLQCQGRYIFYGTSSHQYIKFPWHILISRNIKIETFYLTKWLINSTNQEIFVQSLQLLGKLFTEGKLIINVNHIKIAAFKNAFDSDSDSVENRISKRIIDIPTDQDDYLTWKTQNDKINEIGNSVFSNSNLLRRSDSMDNSTESGGLKVISINPIGKHDGTIVFLHSRSDIPEEYEIHFKTLMSRDEIMSNMKIVIPYGPEIYFNNDDQDELHSWSQSDLSKVLNDSKDLQIDSHDLNIVKNSLNEEKLTALQQLEHACDLVAELIENESKITKSKKIILCGFDEGATVTLFTALTKLYFTPINLAVCFGTPAISPKILNFVINKSEACPFNMKIFFLTGSHDEITTPEISNEMRNFLVHKGFKFTLAESIPNGKHCINLDALSYLSSIISIAKN